MSHLIFPAMTVMPSGGLSLTEAAARRDPEHCSVGLFCGEHTDLTIPESIEAGICCCCRFGTRHHD